MKQLQKLAIYCSSQKEVKQLITNIQTEIRHKPEWKKVVEKASEKREYLLVTDAIDSFQFRYLDASSKLDWVLSLAQEANYHLQVTNIVPSANSSMLDPSLYNRILTEFKTQILDKVLEGLSFQPSVKFTAPIVTVEDLLPSEVVTKLRSFSTNANKLGIHALDEKRWREFLIAAHKAGIRLEAKILKTLLIEQFAWNEILAGNLASQYENALELLEAYDAVLKELPTT